MLFVEKNSPQTEHSRTEVCGSEIVFKRILRPQRGLASGGVDPTRVGDGDLSVAGHVGADTYIAGKMNRVPHAEEAFLLRRNDYEVL